MVFLLLTRMSGWAGVSRVAELGGAGPSFSFGDALGKEGIEKFVVYFSSSWV